MSRAAAAALLVLCVAAPARTAPDPRYPWLGSVDFAQTLAARLPPPPGFAREPTPAGSFAAWLRGLPLKPGTPPVYLHDGRRKANQAAHAAVLDVDVGRRDLQQCADAVMRLRAEYLYAAKRPAAIHFNFTSGHEAAFPRWARGDRPVVAGNSVRWTRQARADATYPSLRRYLEVVFRYAGTASLTKELVVARVEEIQPGDVFIRGGAPGHAVIVLDVAAAPGGGERRFLLAQSYMPAQDIHVLKNPGDPRLSPWYATSFGQVLVTPEWVFRRDELKRWR
ncbi:MAG TPA: DUF4846 domain-containing protein [Polyangia bacterium]|jgi:hypothetical protein